MGQTRSQYAMEQDVYNQLTPTKKCEMELKVNYQGISLKFLGFVLMIALCNVLPSKKLFKRFSVPRIALEILVAIIFGNFDFDMTTRLMPPKFEEAKTLPNNLPETLEHISELVMICNMFVLGLEMEPSKMFRRPTREHIVSYAGMLTSFILGAMVVSLTHLFTKDIHKPKDPKAKRHSTLELVIAMSTTLAGTASPVLNRLITDTKIGKSDIGKFAVLSAMHTDFVFSTLICIGYFYNLYLSRHEYHGFDILWVIFLVVVQIVCVSMVGPIFLKWINTENPEGKPMEGPHLVLSIAFMVLACASSTAVWYNSVLSAFIVGFCLPREGRVSRMMISKVNYLLTNILYPTYFFWIGMVTKMKLFEDGRIFFSIKQFVVLLVITILGKVSGTVLSGMLLGFHWQESLALGLLLSMKGHIHAYIAVMAMRRGYLYVSTCWIMILVILLSVAYTPAVVALIIKRARKRSPNKKMALQWTDPTSELGMLLCVQNPKNVPSTINFMEISRGTADPGIAVYVTDMIEMTERVAATLVQQDGMEAVTVSDRAVNEMRENITDSIQAYLDDNDDGITLRRMLALSSINKMHQEICVLAEDLMATLIVLPFHRLLCGDGNLDEGHPGFRYVNHKVLQEAPRSVGILVDRGLGLIDKISRAYPSLNAAIIFIGGKDDREALAYAGRMACHQGVHLTVIRLLLDTTARDEASARGGRRAKIVEQEEEMRLDDESFAKFYDKQVASGHVAYMEKHLANSSETFSTLRSLEGQYELIIVGRGKRVNSILTVGMNDWEQCPELGPIGDILSSTHFTSTTSVFIIQQHSLKGELDGLDDEFTIM